MDRIVADEAAASRKGRRSVAYYMDSGAWPGGAETWLSHVMYGLAEAGWHVSLFLSDRRATDAWVPELEARGVTVARFRPTREIDAGGFVEARRLLAGFSLVHFNKTHPRALLPAIPAARAAGARVVVSTEHVVAAPSSRYPFGRQLVAGMVRRTNARLDVVTVPCEYARRIYSERYGVPLSRVVNVGTAVRLDLYDAVVDRGRVRRDLAIGREDVLAVIVGRLHEGKGLETAVGSVRTILEREPRFRLLLVGTGPLEGALRHLVSRLGLGGVVTFAGRRNDVPELLGASDLLILPSESETAPLTILEAMAAGLPVVATDVGGVSEAVEDGVTGILIRPRDARAIVDAVVSVVGSADRGAAMGRAARTAVRERYGADRLIGAVAGLYERLLAGGEART
jgi:glycosyltransferase involved in cell wall biosynthesis